MFIPYGPYLGPFDMGKTISLLNAVYERGPASDISANQSLPREPCRDLTLDGPEFETKFLLLVFSKLIKLTNSKCPSKKIKKTFIEKYC